MLPFLTEELHVGVMLLVVVSIVLVASSFGGVALTHLHVGDSCSFCDAIAKDEGSLCVDLSIFTILHELLPYERLNLLEDLDIILGYDGNGSSLLTGSSSSTHSVDVVLAV